MSPIRTTPVATIKTLTTAYDPNRLLMDPNFIFNPDTSYADFNMDFVNHFETPDRPEQSSAIYRGGTVVKIKLG